jgi:hypothetical protein
MHDINDMKSLCCLYLLLKVSTASAIQNLLTAELFFFVQNHKFNGTRTYFGKTNYYH